MYSKIRTAGEMLSDRVGMIPPKDPFSIGMILPILWVGRRQKNENLNIIFTVKAVFAHFFVEGSAGYAECFHGALNVAFIVS